MSAFEYYYSKGRPKNVA